MLKETCLWLAEEDLELDEEGLNGEDSILDYDESRGSGVLGAGAIPTTSYDYQSLFTGGLNQLRTELE